MPEYDFELRLELEEIKKIIKTPNRNKDQKYKLNNFLTRLGDGNSDLNKTIKGANMAKNFVIELIKIGEKLKDFIS